MSAADLKILFNRIQSWPETAQDELIAIAGEIESGLQSVDYHATPDELRAIDEAISSLDAGEIASDAEVEAAFAKFRAR